MYDDKEMDDQYEEGYEVVGEEGEGYVGSDEEVEEEVHVMNLKMPAGNDIWLDRLCGSKPKY